MTPKEESKGLVRESEIQLKELNEDTEVKIPPLTQRRNNEEPALSLDDLRASLQPYESRSVALK